MNYPTGPFIRLTDRGETVYTMQRQNELREEIMENRINDYIEQALTDAPLFRILDDDYEIIDRDLVQRMLNNFELAVKEINFMHNIALAPRNHIDAITTCLHQMKRKLEDSCRHEVESAK